MKENKSIGFVSLIILVIIFSILLPFRQKEPEEPKVYKPCYSIHITIPLPNVAYCLECSANNKKVKSVLDKYTNIRNAMDTVTLPTVEMKLTSLGTYYITGYTAWELGGSTATASGATCHKSSYSNRLIEPTTCAIDPALHDFGDLFYIPYFDTVYIAEDTGSAVKGKHLDLYYGTTYEDNQIAACITGYHEVFAVEFVYGSVPATNYDIQGQVADLVIGWKLTDEMKGVTNE